ncbi:MULTISPECIES: hypothetical protein [Moraxella]|uniref:hypothetical protein n=1 Tax=Moraxella TaxID=475 RepID=UPI0007E45E86|nr:hypothetical protein [Moraxella catarrhalis]STY80921.1 Uncharacterised protein [Moraxella catarrhalis]
MFKKIILSALISAGLVATSTSALGSNAVQADLCFTYNTTIDAKWQCKNLSNGAPLSIDEIYSHGYRVISSEFTGRLWLIIIEKK